MRLLNILTHLDFVITGFNFTMTPSPFGHSQGVVLISSTDLTLSFSTQLRPVTSL